MANHATEFRFEHNGTSYSCFYEIEGEQLLRVSTPWGPKSTALGNSPALITARIMAGELARSPRSFG